MNGKVFLYWSYFWLDCYVMLIKMYISNIEVKIFSKLVIENVILVFNVWDWF